MRVRRLRHLLIACAVMLMPAALAQGQAAQPQAPPPGTRAGDASAAAPQTIPMAAPQMAPPLTASRADLDFSRGMSQMHQSMMAVHNTGNTDRDFVLNMLPHHQGAVDMAQTELRYGHDPSLRRLATGIIAAQRNEIAEMNAWLLAHPP